jgi:hypothetical protein
MRWELRVSSGEAVPMNGSHDFSVDYSRIQDVTGYPFKREALSEDATLLSGFSFCCREVITVAALKAG